MSGTISTTGGDKALGMDVTIDRSTANAAEAKAGLAAWYGLGVLVATTLFAFVDRQIINLIAPSLQRDLAISDMQLGLIHGIGLALFASLASYPIGWLSDHFGRRLIFACCIILWSVSTAACAFQQSFTGIFAATAGIAIGEAALGPIVFSMLPDLFPERQRNTANFIFFGATLLGAAIGLGFGGLMLEWLQSHQQSLPGIFSGMATWRVALILVALPGPFFVLLLTTIRLRGDSGRIDAGGAADLDRVIPFLRAHWRPFALIYGAIFFYSLPLNSAYPWLPVAMPRIFPGMDPAAIGMPLGISVGIGTIIGLALAPTGLALLGGDRALRPLSLARLVMAAAILPSLFLLIASEPWHIYASVGAQLALMLAAGALMPGLLQQLCPSALRSRLISVLGISTAIGTGLAPMTVGALSGLLDPQRGLLTAIVIVSLPAWVIASILISLARRPFMATVAAVNGENE